MNHEYDGAHIILAESMGLCEKLNPHEMPAIFFDSPITELVKVVNYFGVRV